MSENEKNKPVFKAKFGTIDAAVWEQEGKDGKFLTVSASRNYKDGEEWKKTNSLRVNDIPAMQTALQKCFEFAKQSAKQSQDKTEE